MFCVEGVRAGARGTPAARTLCGWHVGMHVHVCCWVWVDVPWFSVRPGGMEGCEGWEAV